MLIKKFFLIILLIDIALLSSNCKKKSSLDPQGKKTYENIFEAVISGDCEAVNEFLSYVEVDIKDNMGQTPLHDAAAYGQFEVAKLLIDKGANVNTTNKMGGTPIGACTMGRGRFLDVAELLIEHGAQINVRDKNGPTALHKSVINGQPKMIELLLENGADPTIKSNGQTPLDLAEVLTKTDFRRGSSMYKRRDKFEECRKILQEFSSK